MRAFTEANMESRSEWSFYPRAGQAKSYHVGKRCFPLAQPRPQPCPQPRPQLRPQLRPLERTLEDCLGRKKPVRAGEPVPGSRPYQTPEYSPDFHKPVPGSRPYLTPEYSPDLHKPVPGPYLTPEYSPDFHKPVPGSYLTPEYSPDFHKPVPGSRPYQTPEYSPDFHKPVPGPYQTPEYSPDFHKPVPGSRPYQTPEYSPDFHKMGSTRISPFHVADTFIPLQPPAVIPSKPYIEKRRVANREIEVMEVRSLDHWTPAPDMLKRFLLECDLMTLA